MSFEPAPCFEPVCAVERVAIVNGEEMRLWVDPIALAALRASAAAGGGTDFGALPTLEEIPLRVLVIEARLDQLEAETWIMKAPPLSPSPQSRQGLKSPTSLQSPPPAPPDSLGKPLSPPKPRSRSRRPQQPRPSFKRPNGSPR